MTDNPQFSNGNLATAPAWGGAEAILFRLSRLSSGLRDPQQAAPDSRLEDSPTAAGIDELLASVPWLRREDFRGQRVIDYGSGRGKLAIALSPHVAEVIGLECRDELIEATTRRAKELGLENVRYLNSLKPESDGLSADLVISQNSFEHFDDPAAILADCAKRLRPRGRMLITFGPPWFHPYGHHMTYFCRVPWFHLMFPERAVMNVRARFRDDGARCYDDVPGGLNRMSLRRFKKLIAASPFTVKHLALTPSWGLKPLLWLPGLRELFIAEIACELVKKA